MSTAGTERLMEIEAGFHEGELAVQARAGTRAEAQRLSGMLAPAHLNGGAGAFLAAQTLAVITARDGGGRLWTSPLTGAAGFLAGRDTTLAVATAPAGGDPLADLPPGQDVGLVAIDLATRRRLRVNGTLRAVTEHGLSVEVAQAYGNCPKYIRPRVVVGVTPGSEHGAVRGDALTPEHVRWIERADTFFLGTAHPGRGADASHRGGPPGFVRVDHDGLRWPDFPGNNMFNSLGNLEVNDEAALLFLDFATGATLHLSGTASVEWPERTVHFRLAHLVEAAGLGVRDTDDRHPGGNP